jgi:hypothetical protein
MAIWMQLQLLLLEEKIKEIVLYFEPFVAYIPEVINSLRKREPSPI